VKRISIDDKDRFLETFIDISEPKRADAVRLESENLYRALFENSRDAMVVLAPPAWTFVAANAATREMFGVKDEATFLSLAPWNVSPATQPDGRPSADKALDMIKIAMLKGTHAFEWRHQRLDGCEISASVQLTRLEFAGQSLLQATIRDLSPTERDLSALRDSEEQLEKIFNHSSNAMALTELTGGKVLNVNEAWVRQSGLSRSHAIGKSPAELGLWICWNDCDACYQALEREGRLHEFETELVLKGVARQFVVNAEFVELRRGRFLLWEFRDITERKRAEETPSRYELLAMHSRDIVLFVQRDDGRILDANAAALGTYGYSRDELLSLSIGELRAPDTKTLTEEQMAIADAHGILFETVHRRKDGSTLPVEVSSAGATIGGVRMLMSVVRDITERKRAESALRESEEQLESMFNCSTNGLSFTEAASGKILKVNDTWVRITGISRSDAIRKTPLELDMWTHKHEREACLATLGRDGRLRDCEATLTIRGGERSLILNADFVDLNSRRYLLWELRDITERKHAQEEIALLKHSIDVHYDAAYWTDSDGRFIYVNDAGCKALGFERGELIGKTLLDVNENATAERMTHVWETLRAKGFHTSESTHRRKDGSEFPVELLTSYVRFGGKEYTCGFARDMTEHKRAAAERSKLTDQLQQAQKMESVGRLAGGVAHDFNNMLGVILGHAELALEGVESTGPLHNALVNIQSAAQRSADLTRQLLAFARKQTVAPKALNLNDTVAGMLNMARRLIGEDIRLEWRPGEKLWPVHVDPTQIDQILANLCVNARDAIANVGRIAIETGNKVIGAGLAANTAGMVPGDYVWLAVSDDGCGMDPATLSHAFEPFFTTKEVGKGTGLGLATVYGIVKQNNGFVDAHSELGKGTVFTIYLPRYVGKAVPVCLDGATGTVEPGRETILLVEDEASLLEITQRMLESRGYKVLTASTPGQAIRLACEHAGTIDLLITDVVMPEMNGRDLAKNILSLYPQTKRLFMSGYTADVIAHQGVLDKGVFFIQKPFLAQDLAARVRKVLEG
jgi:PAS domain S-box-containing protein